MSRHARLINFPKHIRALLNTHRRKAFVDRKVDAGNLATIHSLESNQVAAFISDGDAHRYPDLYGFGARARYQPIRVFYV
jgi:hypothetical protein